MATALESKIIGNPGRFRGYTGKQGATGTQGAQGVRGSQGGRGRQGAGFWEDTSRKIFGNFEG